MRRGSILSALLVPAAVVVLAGCITPPAIRAGGGDRLPVDELPPDARAVAVRVADDALLRGVFVPSDPGAPVVLHLLESGGSATHGTRGIGAYPYLERLADAGFASLVLDYRGVGMSDGERSPWNLRDDARAAWREAVRLAGAPGRVVVRGVSIGTLAAASLLDEGARPGAVVLVAPVRAETAAGHFVRRSYGAFFGGLTALFLRDAGDVDLVAAIRSCRSPLFVVAADKDSVLPPDERATVAAAVDDAGGLLHVIPRETHLGIVLRMNELDTLESAFLRAVFPGVPAASDRLAALPADVPNRDRVARFVLRRRVGSDLASASGRPGFPHDRWGEELVVRWWRDLIWSRREPFSTEDAATLLSLSDPSGVDLDPRELPNMRRLADLVRDQTELDGDALASRLVVEVRERGFDSVAVYERAPEDGVADPLLQMMQGIVEVRVGQGEMPDDAPARLALSPQESLRLAARLLLKSAGYPERVRQLPDGTWEVEVRTLAGWRPLGISESR